MWTSRQKTDTSGVTALSAQLSTEVRRLFVFATVAAKPFSVLLAASYPFSALPFTSTGPQSRSSPAVAGAGPSMLSRIQPPVFGSAIGSKFTAAIAAQHSDADVGIFVRVVEVRLSIRAWAKADITVRRAAIALLLFETTSVPARPRLAIPRIASAIMTSMSVMPRGVPCRLVFKTAPPEEPAEQAGGCGSATVHARAFQRPGAARRRVEAEDLLVGDHDQRPGGRVEHRRAARATHLLESGRAHVIVGRVRAAGEQQPVARAVQAASRVELRNLSRGGGQEELVARRHDRAEHALAVQEELRISVGLRFQDARLRDGGEQVRIFEQILRRVVVPG